VGLPALDVVVAESFGQRLRGLAGRDANQFVPLLLPRCRSVHTFGMRASIDVVWLDLSEAEDAEVLAIECGVDPRRLVRAPRGAPRRSTGALELAAGDAGRRGLAAGDRIVLHRSDGA
jgi:uncharacterized membrane protein (UPF0127 family)